MKSVFVVLSERPNPIAITHPWPIAAFATRKDANQFVKNKQLRSNGAYYGVMRVKFTEKNNESNRIG